MYLVNIVLSLSRQYIYVMINPPELFFIKPQSIAQKQYEALRMFYFEKVPAKDVANRFGYTYRGFTTICSNFRANLKAGHLGDLFFKESKKGRKTTDRVSMVKADVVDMRKKFYSVQDIKVIMDGVGHKISERTIHGILRAEGFGRLPRRMNTTKDKLEKPNIEAPKSQALHFDDQLFKSASVGILCLLPIIENYGISKAIETSDYPETKAINRLSSILSFIALKSSNIARYTTDDLWCTDRGLGLFASLNVLPKASWFTSYSHRVTSQMNRSLLKSLHKVWLDNGLLGDTSNLDFTTIPYWGDGDHLENNWSGKRGKAMVSMLAVLAQDPDTGIIDYGDVNVCHENQSAVILEYLDFYNSSNHGPKDLRYLVFDSKFTNYENLNKLNQDGVCFVTIRRRGKNLVDRLNDLPKQQWKTIRVQMAGNKKRTIKVYDELVSLRGYDGELRQISITGHGKIKPAIIITNELEMKVEDMVRKYTRRWIVEKGISEQIDFFHLNRVSSSMVIKVDFDFTMTILTHNLFRLFAKELPRYSHLSDSSIYQKFLHNMGDVEIKNNKIIVKLKKKRHLPAILELTQAYTKTKYPWLNNSNLIFEGASYS